VLRTLGLMADGNRTNGLQRIRRDLQATLSSCLGRNTFDIGIEVARAAITKHDLQRDIIRHPRRARP
jgi:hypothetical protein